jgi:hypothetical protein
MCWNTLGEPPYVIIHRIIMLECCNARHTANTGVSITSIGLQKVHNRQAVVGDVEGLAFLHVPCLVTLLQLRLQQKVLWNADEILQECAQLATAVTVIEVTAAWKLMPTTQLPVLVLSQAMLHNHLVIKGMAYQHTNDTTGAVAHPTIWPTVHCGGHTVYNCNSTHYALKPCN